MTKSADKIFNECIQLLRRGKSVLDCLKKYPKVRGLKGLLSIVQTGMDLPKKELTFDRRIIWNKIESKISTPNQVERVTFQSRQNPFAAFRFAFPKTVIALIVVVVIAGLVNGTAVKAKNALPGQTLYPVKKTMEKAELVLTFNDEKKTEKKIRNASTRLQETQAIVEKNDIPKSDNKDESSGDKATTTEDVLVLNEEEAKVVEETLAELSSATEEVAGESEGNKGLLKKIVKLSDEQEEFLSGLEPKLSGNTKESVAQTRTVAKEKKERAEQNLFELEEQEKAEDSATTTDELIEDGKTEGSFDENKNISTTTEEKVEILGEPTASSTEIFTPLTENNGTLTSTPEIIDLR